MYAKWRLMWQVSGRSEAHSPLIGRPISRTLYWAVVISTESLSCADPWIFTEGGGGGGGVQARLSENSSSFLIPNIVIFQEIWTPYSPLDPHMKAKTDQFSFSKWAVYSLMLWPSEVRCWYETIGKCANRLIIWTSTRDFCKPSHRIHVYMRKRLL